MRLEGSTATGSMGIASEMARVSGQQEAMRRDAAIRILISQGHLPRSSRAASANQAER